MISIIVTELLSLRNASNSENVITAIMNSIQHRKGTQEVVDIDFFFFFYVPQCTVRPRSGKCLVGDRGTKTERSRGQENSSLCR